jgi:hypothetical protein
MGLNAKQIEMLLKMIRDTKDVELTCPECLAEMDRYAQSTLDEEPLDRILELVREHLAACPACESEFQLILDTLKAIEEE